MLDFNTQCFLRPIPPGSRSNRHEIRSRSRTINAATCPRYLGKCPVFTLPSSSGVLRFGTQYSPQPQPPDTAKIPTEFNIAQSPHSLQNALVSHKRSLASLEGGPLTYKVGATLCSPYAFERFSPCPSKCPPGRTCSQPPHMFFASEAG